MSLLAVTFPGQGSQYVGMGKKLLEQFPACASAFEEAEDAVHLNLRRLCFDGPDDELRLTANTQPAILTVSIAQWRVIKAECHVEPSLFLGHSLGEYSALVASGRISLSTAAALVHRRGQEMQQAVPAGAGAMAAVLNCSTEALQALCEAHSRPREHVAIVNFNSPAQLVVAGHKPAVDRLCQDLETQKLRFVMLAVSAPFHSKLMEPAKAAMTPVLEAIAIQNNASQVIPNLFAKPTADYKISYLIDQIDHPVLWMQSMTAAADAGITSYLEVGPGKVLTGLTRRCLSRDTKCLVGEDTVETIKALSAGS